MRSLACFKNQPNDHEPSAAVRTFASDPDEGRCRAKAEPRPQKVGYYRSSGRRNDGKIDEISGAPRKCRMRGSSCLAWAAAGASGQLESGRQHIRDYLAARLNIVRRCIVWIADWNDAPPHALDILNQRPRGGRLPGSNMTRSTS